MKLTTKEIGMIAALERQMDDGTQPYVVNDGNRWAFSSSLMDKVGLVSGQTVSNGLLVAIMEARIAELQDLIAADAFNQEAIEI